MNVSSWLALGLFPFLFFITSLQMKRKAATQKTKKTTTSHKKRRTTGDYQAGRELPGVPKQELKAFDVALRSNVFMTVAGPPTFDVLNAQVNGAELYQRVGRKTYMKSIHIRGVIQPNAAGSESAVRMLLIYDSQPNKVAPLITDLLLDSNAAAGTTWASEINLINRQRFKILKDTQFLLGSVTNVAGNSELIPDPIRNSLNVEMFLKLNGLETIYNATNGGTIADISSGAIFLVCVGDANAGSFQFNYTSRLRYYD